jgi:hypothetical protein
VPFLKNEAPPETLDIVARVEAVADDCWRTLDIRYFASNVARWGVLVGGVRTVERQLIAAGRDTPDFAAALINLGRVVTVALKWAVLHGLPHSTPLRWTGELSRAVEQCLDTARPYAVFELCFPAFHREQFAVDVIGPERLRFSNAGGERARQVSAYQKGIRPTAGPRAVERPAARPQDERTATAFEDALRRCRQRGALSFECEDPWELWETILPEYRERVSSITRRPEDLSLGPYTLREFNDFYAALLVMAAATEHLCFLWQRTVGEYPLESAVIVRSVREWVVVLARLSGVSEEKCEVMIGDLTFDPQRTLDLKVHPMVPLEDGTLALAPPFPLSSRHDENILRVCSQRRQTVYDAISGEKEGELLDTLRRIGRFGLDGPARLPQPHPDIDLLGVDDASSSVVIAELKWVRKTIRPLEIERATAEVVKGIGQLRDIQRFLGDAPEHLRAIGRLPRSLAAYEHVYYLLVARDHWVWVEPQNGISIVSFDAFVEALNAPGTLHENLQALLGYDWLPVEGRDFYVNYDATCVNGVCVESPIYYAGRANANRPVEPAGQEFERAR